MLEEDLQFTDGDIIDAIKELNNHSAAGPDDVPATLIRQCADSVLIPLKIMWRSSLECGIVPELYKQCFVCPVHKKGDKVTPGNYRPIALTSHMIKVFERVLRKKMILHLDRNLILSDMQHGFRSGRSTLTQLLSHWDDILCGLL